ncbi:MAG: 8-amino-7-oxononanoate synthase, partial [Proteobacteria bacterium]|nr:8-amino-7-oxononanoate synthase [Pseudomonadota bacterium]MYJ96283.1 8-amino-7-oxononanoate synthase [Pseudomonadota bacterium]
MRTMIATERRPRARTRQQSDELISFACNDYLGLSHHPAVVAASREATEKYGTGAGASRLITGNNPLYAGLETALAEIKNTEDAVVFGSGYLANIGVVPTLAARQDLILMDELCHACLHAGATLARCRTIRYRHLDLAELSGLLRELRPTHRHCLVLTDGVFSMDGDRAPVDDLLGICQKHDAWLMTDDAHGLGVIENGCGSGFVGGRAVPIPLQMGTLSKAVGAYGGYLCTNADVAELIRNRARSLQYATGLPPGTLAAATAALDLIATDRDLVRKPLERARRFAHRLGLAAPESPIVPIVLGDARRTMQVAEALRRRGYLVGAIRPPTVPDGTARLRLTFSAVHAEEDVDRLATAVEEVLPGR